LFKIESLLGTQGFEQQEKNKQLLTDCYFNLGQLHQFGYGAERDSKVSLRFYKKAAQIGNHFKAYSKCGDFYYSSGDKKSAMSCYKKAADLGDVSALNNIGLILESGYDDVMPSSEHALLHFKAAHNLGNSDATINIAMQYLSQNDTKIAKALLINAYQNRNQRAVDVMIKYGIIQSRSEVEGMVQSYSIDDSVEYAGI
jgi:TPR repeat protein